MFSNFDKNKTPPFTEQFSWKNKQYTATGEMARARANHMFYIKTATLTDNSAFI